MLKWEAGSQLEFAAFDGYFRGMPPLDRIVVRIVPDANTEAANILSGDLDVLLEQVRVEQAYVVAQGIGYLPITPGDQHPMNHLPTLVRKTGWEWSGDHFAADIPISLELHFQVWNSEMERFAPAGLEHFWARRERRVERHLKGKLRVTSFDRADVHNLTCRVLEADARHDQLGRLREPEANCRGSCPQLRVGRRLASREPRVRPSDDGPHQHDRNQSDKQGQRASHVSRAPIHDRPSSCHPCRPW